MALFAIGREVAMTDARIQGTALAGGAIAAALVDMLHTKGILSLDDARAVLNQASRQLGFYSQTPEGVEAQRIIFDLLRMRFPTGSE
jgi:hypothetical protein